MGESSKNVIPIAADARDEIVSMPKLSWEAGEKAHTLVASVTYPDGSKNDFEIMPRSGGIYSWQLMIDRCEYDLGNSPDGMKRRAQYHVEERWMLALERMRTMPLRSEEPTNQDKPKNQKPYGFRHWVAEGFLGIAGAMLLLAVILFFVGWEFRAMLALSAAVGAALAQVLAVRSLKRSGDWE